MGAAVLMLYPRAQGGQRDQGGRPCSPSTMTTRVYWMTASTLAIGISQVAEKFSCSWHERKASPASKKKGELEHESETPEYEN